MSHIKVLRLMQTGLLTALVCVATMVIKLPTPTNGYVNIGDAAVLLSGWVLGPWYGFFAAGVGSGLADLMGGYGTYIAGSFLIKGAMAAVAAMAVKYGGGTVSRVVFGVLAELLMVLGYFVYESVLLGYGLAATASVFGNAMQGIVGTVIGVLLYGVFEKNGLLKQLK